MRDMTPEEIEKIKKIMTDDLNELIAKGIMSFSTYPSMQTRHGGWGTNVTESGHHNPYHTPERDEQGTFYGYKILHRHCDHPACDMFISPRYPAEWKNGELHSDMEPAEGHGHGIHFTKRFDHPELMSYRIMPSTSRYRIETWVLVKCALSGTIVETEQGFRAQHAQIIGVLVDGNWKSYQDYQECASANSYPNPYQEGREWGENPYAKFPWNPNP